MATATGNFNFDEVEHLDKAIEVLFDCRPLPESQIKALCEKVSNVTKESKLAHLLVQKRAERRKEVFKLCKMPEFG